MLRIVASVGSKTQSFFFNRISVTGGIQFPYALVKQFFRAREAETTPLCNRSAKSAVVSVPHSAPATGAWKRWKYHHGADGSTIIMLMEAP